MKIFKKVMSAILTTLMVQSVLTTSLVVTTSAYQTTANESTAQTQVQESSNSVYGNFLYTVSDGKVTITEYMGNAATVNIPSEIEGKPVTSIEYSAFRSCSSLTSVEIPNSVTSIGSYAFDSCSSLTSVEIPNSVTNIEDGTFYGCSSLTSVEIPNSVTSIGDLAFMNCISLMSVEIPNSVTSIGSGAFEDCSSLTIVTIGKSVTNIVDSAFYGCSSLTNINVDSNNVNYSSTNGILFNKNKTELICYPAGKTNKSYTIPNSVTSIGYGAFWRCSNLTSVEIPNSVTSIGDEAFYKCISLTSITIPNSVTSIGSYAFEDCSSLKDVYYTGTQEEWKKIYIDFYNGCLTDTTVHYNYSGVLLDKETLHLEVGQMYTLTATAILPTETTFTWKSNNTSVATINKAGRVVARGEGTAIITVISSEGKRAYCTVTVSPKKELILDKTELSLSEKQQYILKPSMSPEDTSVTYTFKSSNASVASVNSSGRIVARGDGIATITVIASNGLRAYCTVNVFTPRTLSLNKTKLNLLGNEQFVLQPFLSPEDTNVTYTFKSSNADVASVNSAGRVYGRGEGTATITVIGSNGLKAYCTVNVSLQKVLVLDKTELNLALKEQYTLTPSVIPEDTEVTYTFKSDNTAVATVNKAGRIVARGTGTATIKVISSNGLTATCTVTVS